MPVYEYEPDDRECLICDGKVAILQEVGEEPARYCPHCGLEIKRIVSKASFSFAKDASPEEAAKKGFTVYRRLETGVYEKAAGEGVDVLKKSDLDAIDP